MVKRTYKMKIELENLSEYDIEKIKEFFQGETLIHKLKEWYKDDDTRK